MSKREAIIRQGSGRRGRLLRLGCLSKTSSACCSTIGKHEINHDGLLARARATSGRLPSCRLRRLRRLLGLLGLLRLLRLHQLGWLPWQLHRWLLHHHLRLLHNTGLLRLLHHILHRLLRLLHNTSLLRLLHHILHGLLRLLHNILHRLLWLLLHLGWLLLLS
jgi:hypothetical protein